MAELKEVQNKGWTVTLAGLGINLALGILYTWSIFKESIASSIKAHDGRFTWDLANLNDPYAVCCLVFAATMIVAGRLQDRFSPRITAVIGGILTGLGLMWISLTYSLWTWILGFGVLTGMGLGFGYASATPPAIKWFAPSKTGLIAGIVVAGFGLASVYIAPLSEFLIGRFGLSTSMMVFGGGFLLVVVTLAQFLVNPPAGYKPEIPAGAASVSAAKAHAHEFAPMEMLKTGAFWKLWFLYCVGSGAGLMIIGNVAGMAKASLGAMAWVVVALMAIGNAGGRVVAGVLSDKIGRTRTLLIMLSMQSVVMFALWWVGASGGAIFMVLAATFIGFNYGTNLSLFPSAAKDYFGIKNFGVNYGLLFTAWGVGGFVLPKLSQMIVAATGTFSTAYILAAGLLAVSAAVAPFIKSPQKVMAPMRPALGAANGYAFSSFFTHMLKKETIVNK
jgi:nitrate/nitrite transporter NarK